MKRVFISEVEAGMVLAQAVYNLQNSLELLSAGSVLKENHIRMLEQLGVIEVMIYEESDRAASAVDSQEHSEYELEGQYSIEFEEIKAIDYHAVVTSVCNRNMQIQLLTGEGNIPVDVKHKAAIEQTKLAFDEIKAGGALDKEALEAQVEQMLPDMIRNNDVLMRLNQLKASDDYTFTHALRVSMLSCMIGKWLGYTLDQLKDLALAGLLYDIGKLRVPQELLNKPGPLTPSEFEVVSKHAQLGYVMLLKTAGISQDIKFAALQHHERMDGTGYPLKVRSGQIHEYSKIIMVCDTFDAMIQDRVYKKKVSPFQAAEYISWHSGTAFDARICYILLSNLSEFYVGKFCTLSSGEKGRIVYIDVNEPTRPIVQIGNHFVDLTKKRDIFVSELE